MKKLIVFCVLITSILTLLSLPVNAEALKLTYDGAVHYYTGDIYNLKLDGEPIVTDEPPVIINDRTLVPARAVFEKMGAVVDWDSSAQKVTVSLENTVMKLKINDTNVDVNGKSVTLDVPARIINGRTMLPLRFVGEQLNMKVGWFPDKLLITLDHMDNAIQTQSNSSLNSIEDIISFIKGNATDDISVDLDDKKNGTKEYNIFRLSSPDRIIVDIQDTNAPSTQQKLDISGTYVESVRYAQYDETNSRVVLDLTGKSEYQAKLVDKQLVLYVSAPEEILSEPSRGDDVDRGDIVSLADRLVVIDAGHGGTDPGAVYGNVLEKDLNLDIATRLNTLLNNQNIKTYMTRTDDSYVDLHDRAYIANSLNADLFLSIHNNANDQTSKGTETLYYPSDAEAGQYTSKIFAQTIQDKLVSELGTVDGELVPRPNLVVLNKTEMPAALAEIGFIDNKDDRENLLKEDFRQKAAEALCDAVIQALGECG